MRKIFLLPFCISCVCGISACSNHSYNTPEEIFISDEDAAVIDATTNPRNKCGVDGISCNENALVNYTRTEADFREYGERTRRDHLYTQAGTGNNLTASIRPTVEDDVVKATPIAPEKRPHNVSHQNPQMFSYPTPQKNNDGVFKRTATKEVESQPVTYRTAPQLPTEKLGQSNNLKQAIQEPASKQRYSYEVVCEDGNCTRGQPYEMVCQGSTCTKTTIDTATSTSVCDSTGFNCESRPQQYKTVCDEECEDIVNADNNVITSEFTEESFDIADYIQPDEEEISFTEVGDDERIVADIDISEIRISDDTVLTWEAEEGENLRELLTKWSAMAGWKLLWQTNRNYILSAGVMFKGKFADVSSALVRAFARARPAPIATYYKGNRVIVVETMENENAY